ncbi:peptide-methionine (S)-S-oxide reductase MsrA [Motilimonas pumila]|uniref:Peptide methionine sulfoxide reductase MsrA n=1 Tax=Motilimonas pumila TaxID=2303987 RepID=A0A418YCT2_9GAMM|nr:peptide-methionine (S)-S-oxide reductase MsrA [Motilimonas pumila]RJG42333.1 peptide-methionine (S)-S-oxide reductase MsrA [Motilimonas pumila]
MAASKIMVSAEKALKGRENALPTPSEHFVFHTQLQSVAKLNRIWFGMGCFWGAERLFWQQSGVKFTSVGYGGGFTPHPTYEEVCSGETGHTELVEVIYDPTEISLRQLLALFWQQHDPTQGMQQGHDVGTQYRSAIYTNNADDLALARLTQQQFQQVITQAGYDNQITTDVLPLTDYYYAEQYHQQYLAKNPNGYCGLAANGLCLPDAP